MKHIYLKTKMTSMKIRFLLILGLLTCGILMNTAYATVSPGFTYAITAASTNACTDVVTLSNTTSGQISGHSYSYTWYWGDGMMAVTTSLSDQVTHTYTYPNTYTAQLNVTDVTTGYYLSSTTQTFTTKGTAPTVHSNEVIYGPNYSGGNGTVLLNGGNSTITSGNLSYVWTVVNTTASPATTATYTTSSVTLTKAQGTSDSVYTAQLTVTDATGGCASNAGASQGFTIVQAGGSSSPIAAAITTTKATTSCTEVVTIHNGSTGQVSGATYNYTWYFGDGASVTTTSLANLTHTYTYPSTYTILLNVYGANNQFITTTSATVTTIGTAPTVHSVAAIYGPTYGSGNGVVTLNGGNSTTTTGNLTYYWTVTGGGVTTHYTTSSVTLAIPQTSSDVIYSAQLTVTDANGGCANDAGTAQNFTIAQSAASVTPVVAGIGTSITTTSCTDVVTISNTTTGQVSGATYHYIWYYGDGNSLNTTSTADISHTYIYPSTYTVLLNITDANGQFVATTSKTVTSNGTAPTVHAIAVLYGPYSSPTTTTATLNGGNSSLSYGNGLTYSWVVTVGSGTPTTYNTSSVSLSIARASADQSVTAVLTVTNGCVIQTASTITFTVPALSSFVKEESNNSLNHNSIVAYPNPVNNLVNLKIGLNKLSENVEVRVFNSIGKQVAMKHLSTGNINEFEANISLGHLVQGVYFVKVFNAEGELIGNTTLLKQ